MSVTDEQKRKNKSLLIKLGLFAVLMVGFSFALVPIYNVLCKVTGLNGKITGPSVAPIASDVDLSRTITVQFLTTINGHLPWQFYPDVKQVKVHPGELKQVTFFAENDTDHAMTVQAIPSITPGLVAKYLKKTQCFCFEQQTLAAHKQKHMPMIFHVDRHIPQKYKTLTVSYTLFDVNSVKPGQQQSHHHHSHHPGKLTESI